MSIVMSTTPRGAIDTPSNITFTFENGYAISIITGKGTYSTHGNTAEIAIFDPFGKFYRISGCDDDVIGWMSAEETIQIAYWVSRGDMNAVDKMFQKRKETA
jgi:hypothetical protein